MTLLQSCRAVLGPASNCEARTRWCILWLRLGLRFDRDRGRTSQCWALDGTGILSCMYVYERAVTDVKRCQVVADKLESGRSCDVSRRVGWSGDVYGGGRGQRHLAQLAGKSSQILGAASDLPGFPKQNCRGGLVQPNKISPRSAGIRLKERKRRRAIIKSNDHNTRVPRGRGKVEWEFWAFLASAQNRRRGGHVTLSPLRMVQITTSFPPRQPSSNSKASR